MPRAILGFLADYNRAAQYLFFQIYRSDAERVSRQK